MHEKASFNTLLDAILAIRDSAGLKKAFSSRVFNDWYEIAFVFFFRLARRRGLSEDDAEDLVSTAMLGICKALPAIKREKAFSYIYSIFLNTLKTYFKSHKRHPMLLFDMSEEKGSLPFTEVHDPRTNSEKKAIYKEFIATLDAILKTLPKRERDLFRLRMMDELSYGALAALYGISDDNVRKIISRTRGMVVQRLQKQGFTAGHFDSFLS